MRVVYVAHPVGAETIAGVAQNLARAKRWYLWLLESYPGLAFNMNWAVDVEVYLNRGVDANVCGGEGDHPTRALGLLRDDAVIKTCHEMILVGGRVSAGMRRALDVAGEEYQTVYDLTHLGDEPPDASIDLDQHILLPEIYKQMA